MEEYQASLLRNIIGQKVDPIALQTVNSQVGSTIWHIQLLEFTLIHYIVMVYGLEPGVERETAFRVLDEVSVKTLGQLIAELRKNNDLDERLDHRLKAFLKERNWLIHRSRADSHLAVYYPDKLAVLIRRLDTLTVEALNLRKAFTSRLEAFMIRIGRTERDIFMATVDQLKRQGVI
jgi:uncharacterized protein YdhG (YjbR/CyaY superfamily)